MKILLINKFHYIKGGSETYYFGLGELLKKYGHEVVYFSMKDEKNRPCAQEKYFVENVDFNKPMSKGQMAKAGLKMLYSFEAKDRLEQLIREEKTDIAHLNIFQSQLTASVVDVLHKYRIPMVYTMHDLKALCPCYTMLTHGQICEKCSKGSYINCVKNSCMKDSSSKSLLAAMEAQVYRWKKTYDKIQLIITPSAFYKKKLEQADITRAKIIHMRNFLPPDTCYQAEPERGSYFLYFGRLSKEKGVLTLLEAYKLADTKTPLYIVGTGPVEQEVKEKIQQLQLTDRVQMLGYKQGDELKEIVKKSLCVVLPSEWYENGPYSIMEAQAAGIPIIVSSNGGLPELIEDGVLGYTVQPKQPADLAEKLKLCEQKPDWDKEKILQWAKKNYDADRYAMDLIDLYTQLVSGSKPE